MQTNSDKFFERVRWFPILAPKCQLVFVQSRRFSRQGSSGQEGQSTLRKEMRIGQSTVVLACKLAIEFH